MQNHSDQRHPALRFFDVLSQFAVFLLLGTAAALVWANLDHEGYKEFIEAPLFHSSWIHPQDASGASLHFIVNDIFMVLFFGIAMKEVAESMLPTGALSSIRKAAMPAIATLGGVTGPIVVFFLLHALLAPQPDFTGGWAIPTATDIAYSWIAAGIIFGRKHPAVTFLVVLAVLDDLIGMGIIAIFYSADLHLAWLALVALAMLGCEVMRRKGVKSFWPYVILGGIPSWFGLHEAGIHTALALVPIIPFMPHAERDAGLFIEGTDAEGRPIKSADTLSRFENWIKPIVDVGLFAFGLVNSGVLLNGTAFAAKPTWIILLSLLIGKTLGIYCFTHIGHKFGLQLPEGLRRNQVFALGMIAGIGFTVALFVTSVYVAISGDPAIQGIEESLKLGALLSFSAAPLGFLLAKILKVQRRP